jgi:SOS response regulatory protein OraA/RecX
LADSAYLHALKLLARRELSVEGLRARLLDRDYPPEDVQNAIDHLLESGALNDARVARAYARTAARVKGRGRLRVVRELHAMGITRDVAAEAVADVFGDLDERTMIARALQKKLRGKPRISSPAEHARLYQFLMRQGFSPAGVVAALRKLGGRRDVELE